MGSKTILQFANDYSTRNIQFISGNLVFKISKGTDGNIVAIHNFNGTWTNVPLTYTVNIDQHLTEHNHINNIEIFDTSGNFVFAMRNGPQLVTF
jgi:hypothetical protein